MVLGLSTVFKVECSIPNAVRISGVSLLYTSTMDWNKIVQSGRPSKAHCSTGNRIVNALGSSG